MIASILVALDHSTRATGVLRLATEIAERFDAKLRLFRAIAIAQQFPAAASNAGHPDPLPAYLEMEAMNELEALASGNRRALAEPPIIAFGATAQGILEAADRVEADLIVVGSHGFHGLDRLLGTVAGSLANRAHRNVLVVHEREAP